MTLINGIHFNMGRMGNGPPVILLHSGLADSRLWAVHLTALAEHFTVIYYDLPGFGETEMHPHPYSHLEDLLSVMAYNEIGRAHVVGMSLGGMIALDFALQYPDAVEKLVLPAASVRGYHFPNAYQWIDAYMYALEDGPDASTAFWLDQPMFDTLIDHPKARALTRVMLRDNVDAWSPIADKPETIWPPGDTIHRLNELAMPTLVMVGERDMPDLVSCANLLAANIPHAELITYPSVGHHFPLEIPDQFTRDLIAFLGE